MIECHADRATSTTAKLLWLKVGIKNFGKTYLKKGGVKFVDGISKRNGAIAGRTAAILIFTFVNHNSFGDALMGGSSFFGKTLIVMLKEKTFQ